LLMLGMRGLSEGLKRRLSKYGKEAPKGISPETYALVRTTIDVLREYGDSRANVLEKRLKEVIRAHGGKSSEPFHAGDAVR